MELQVDPIEMKGVLELEALEVYKIELISSEMFTQADECPNYKHTHMDGSFATEHIRRHYRAMLCKCPKAISHPEVATGTGRKLRPVRRPTWISSQWHSLFLSRISYVSMHRSRFNV